ncbi:DUF2956 domain-containing protein [Aliikangiella maris]|uniref:DUF2956 domain-containing protein n=2 Tax=Aliikangiella maris TaxID=3162458 RepID=A0ABV3MMW4_9GAMM
MNKKKFKTSPETIAEAERVAKSIQKPGQTKEQTKLIAQGIQKGIEQYKKQQKAKARDLDKRLRKVKSGEPLQAPKDYVDNEVSQTDNAASYTRPSVGGRYLPWGLLLLSWGWFFYYVYF